MVNEEILNDERVRNRIIQLEYEELTAAEIRQIYLEETGKVPPTHIDVYHSDDYVDPNTSYGFKGTIIHIYDEEKGYSESYTIPRGTEGIEEGTWKPHDWTYNIMGIFVGQNAGQYYAAEKFDKKVTKEIEKKLSDIDLKKIGWGHSLGGNIITLLQLVSGLFDKVYTTNPAPPTVYQLAIIDEKFLNFLSEEFNIDSNDPLAIYHLDPDELREFATKYYEHAGKDIEHTITKQDILRAISDLRGFFTVGTEIVIDGFPGEDVESLKKLFINLPDQVVKDIQIYLAENLSDVYNQEGFDGFLRELTGVDAEFIDQLIEYEGWEYIENWAEIEQHGLKMIKDIRVKIPELLIHLKALKDKLDPILDVFIELEYMTDKEKEVIIREVDGLEEDLGTILDELDGLGLDELDGIGELSIIDLFKIISALIRMEKPFNSIISRIDIIKDNTEVIRDLVGKGIEAHKTAQVVNSLGGWKWSITGSGDVFRIRNVGGELISVNVSSASRIFMQGMALNNAKSAYLQQLREDYENTYLHDYEKRKSDLLEKIDDMESYPSRYQHLLGNFTPDTHYFYRMTKIDVHDEIPQLPINGFQEVFENMFAYIESEIEKEKIFLDNIRESIEQIVEADEEQANSNFKLEVI